MKTTLNYLPAIKQQELQAIVASIRRHPKVEAIILFGSYARGNWVEEYEDDGIHIRYKSDYDLLVIVKTRNRHRQRDLEADMMSDIEEQLPDINTPVSVITHDMTYIHRQLEKAQFFFSDIKKYGVLLYSAKELDLPDAKKLTGEERYQLAKKDFEHWFPNAVSFFELFEYSFGKKYYNQSAFMLHQATEYSYNTLLLVFTRYKPKLHDLAILRRVTNTFDPRLLKIFPLVNAEEKRLFRLLRDAYVHARYDESYIITHEELTWLAERVKALQALIEVLCQEKMQDFLQEDQEH